MSKSRARWAWVAGFIGLIALVVLLERTVKKETVHFDISEPTAKEIAPDDSVGVTPSPSPSEPGPVEPGAEPLSPPPPETARPAPAASPSDDELLEQSLARLKKGNLAYNTPEKMKVSETAHVTARIGTENVSLSTLEQGMSAENGSIVATAATPVSTRMKMTLKSGDFQITPLSSEEQIVAGNTPTTWSWDIVPRHSGKLRLHLAAVVEINNLSRDFTSVDREIAVQVDPVDAASKFARDNWHWILTTLGAGLAAAWAWWKKRRKPEAPKWETP